MTDEVVVPEPRSYTVVSRSRASAIFGPDEALPVNCTGDGSARARITFSTSFEDKGFETAVPMYLLAEAKGTAPELNTAAEHFANWARGLAAVLAVSTDASMGLLEVDVAYDSTPGATEREFFQQYLPEEPLSVVPARRVHIPATAALISVLEKHKDRERLVRAIGQYSEALDGWTPGAEIGCLAHLFMGMEALTPVAVERHCQETGKSLEALGAEWGFREGKGSMKLKQFVLAETRRRLLFRGDDECHRQAKKASDGLEHGFASFGEIRHVARNVLVATAAYVRGAILELSGLGGEQQAILLSAPYSEPRGPLKLVKYLRGHLLANGQPCVLQGHPRFQWTTTLRRVFLNEAGKYSMTPDEKMTAVIGDGVQFRPKSFQVWDGSTIRTSSPPPLIRQEPSTMTVIRASDEERPQPTGDGVS